jgi:uncharacterized protein DUF1286
LTGGSSPPPRPLTFVWDQYRVAAPGSTSEKLCGISLHGSLKDEVQRKTGQLKALTHDIFSLGVGLFLVFHVDRSPTLLHLALVVWLVFVINEVIDVLGHFTRGDIPVRSFWTHSVFTAPAWGIAVSTTSLYLLDIVMGQALTASQALFAVGLGTVLAYSHLMLDALTEGGVYLGTRRIALAHMRYDNLILNGAFVVLGALLVFAALF